MARIQVLSAHLVNKIAAGEVIERPASVVKELVENALDAGATRIEVAIEKGGQRLISVTDDGGGIDGEQLALAFQPHATSKIRDDDDLFHIDTMGFRGEALASIASVSHASIRTRKPESVSGFEVNAGGEQIGPVRPCASPPGTTVAVRDLFFNTPARRKFLKADSTEIGHISEAITRIALPFRGVAFKLSHNGRVMLDLPATESLHQRVSDLFGHDLADQLARIRSADGAVGVEGLIGPPAGGRSTARWQYFFLNGRYIRDRLLGHALKEAYRGLIDPHRQPVAFVFLRVDPETVDVNVHPTKVEVRFRDGQTVHSHLLAALRETLQAMELRPTASLPGDAEHATDEMPDDPRRAGLREALTQFFRAQPKPEPKLSFPERRDRPSERPRLERPLENAGDAQGRPSSWLRPGSTAPGFCQAREPGEEPAADASEARNVETSPHDRAFAPPRPDQPPPGAEVSHPLEATPPTTSAGRGSARVMQVHDTYLVLNDPDGILIIDQHALHERVIYDQLLHRITDGPLESQRLLLPAVVEVTPQQKAALEEYESVLARLGIEATEFGPRAVAIQRFPSLLDKLDPAAFLLDALDTLAEGDPSTNAEHLVHALLDMMACKAAVKAGDPLTAEEIDALLAQRPLVEKSTACPHGRPTQIRLTLKDLEKQFKRV